jgi:hypothetical protein
MRIIPSIRSLVFLLALLAMSAAAFAQIGVSISFSPPELPVYEQPLCPGDGYLWAPGYWAYGEDDYYWVPGTWVMPPEAGLLWTPAYWGWNGNGYVFNDGYWGTTVGFYGGISYGYGYGGEGYDGGRWQNDHFFYNRTVNNVNVTIVHNVYEAPAAHNNSGSHASFNGGNGGTNARPTAQDQAAAHQKHIPPVAAQVQHVQAARAQPELRASANHGKPPVAATPKPGAFKDHAVVPAKQAGAPYTRPPASHAAAQPTAQPKPNASAAHPENNAARPNPPTPNNRTESNPSSAAHSNSRPEAGRSEPAQSSKAPAQSAPPKAEHAPPPAMATRPAEKQPPQPKPEAKKPQEKKQEEPPKQ